MFLNFVEIKPVKKIDGTSEAAIEAEVRAAKERALIPLEQRIKQFKEMLREKDVSIRHLLRFRRHHLNVYFENRLKSFTCHIHSEA